MKKGIAIIVCLLAVLVLFTGCDRQAAAATSSVDGPPSVPTGRLTVGANAMNGDMFSGWTNLVANADAKRLMFDLGYATIMYTEDDRYVEDPVVVKSLTTTNNPDGGKTYTIEINQNLVWNDGRPITARDYVFSILFSYSKEVRDLGARNWVGGDVYQGFEEYNSGSTRVFTGARLLGDYTFSITVAPVDGDGDPTFPFWFEITYANIGPLPMHVLAPGCDVRDTGSGVEITGPWSLSLVQQTVDNGSTGYRYTPYVTCGPYNFVSYDPNYYQIRLEANPYYLGYGPERAKPLIKTVIFYQVAQATSIDALSTGVVDLLIQMSGATIINAGLDVVDAGKADYITYSRNGFGRITFHCDWGPTQFPEVRRAIAYCMDREEFVRQYTGGYGIIVHSRVGSAQWMYLENKAQLERELTAYSLNVAKAREELEAGGWTLNAQGGAYTSGTRYKRLDDGSLMPLVIEWFSPDSNTIGEMLSGFLTANARSVGMEINQEWGDSTAFGNALYGTGAKRYNMINGGVGFATSDSPWYYYVPNPEMFGSWNTNFIMDESLNRYTQLMRQTTPGDYTTFYGHWLNFVKRFNELLPDIPLYSDEYFDFFTPNLKNFNHNSLYPWTSALLKAYVVE